MADIIESLDSYPSVVREIGVGDPISGGPNGVANIQAKAIADRTRWLKDRQDTSAPFKNRIINGAANVNQYSLFHTLNGRYVFDGTGVDAAGARKVSSSGINDVPFIGDMWKSHLYGAGGAFDGYPVDRPSMKGKLGRTLEVKTPVEYTSAASLLAATGQTVASTYWHGLLYWTEGYHIQDILTSTDKTATISFWFQASLTGEYTVAVRDYFELTQATQTSMGSSWLMPFTYVTANAPQLITLTVDFSQMPSYLAGTFLGTKSNAGLQIVVGFCDSDDQLYTTDPANINKWQGSALGTASTTQAPLATPNTVRWWGTVGNYIHVSEFQLEHGRVFTGYEARPHSVEQALCARYYETGYLLFRATVDLGYQALAPQRANYITPKRIYTPTLKRWFTNLSVAGSSVTENFSGVNSRGFSTNDSLVAGAAGQHYYFFWEARAEIF